MIYINTATKNVLYGGIYTQNAPQNAQKQGQEL